YHGKSYPNCFIGSEAVTWIIEHPKLTKCDTLEKAIVLGNYLIRKGIMHHVMNQHLFKNDYLFYQFSKDIDHESVTYKWNSQDLIAIAKEIRQNVEIRDRTYHFKKYKDCFLGNACVKFLIDRSICTHVPEAIALGNALIEQNIIHHVTDGHKFENGPFFYAFVDLARFDLFHITTSKHSTETIDWGRRNSIGNSTTNSVLLQRLSTGRRTKSLTHLSSPYEQSQTPSCDRHLMPILAESRTICSQETEDHKEDDEKKQTEQPPSLNPTDRLFFSDDDIDGEDDTLYGTFKG
ncbi:hypothetical protein RFI_17447, partial [Reticulomyxa filosa]